MSNSISSSDRQPITGQMQSLIDRWETAGDSRAVFLSCYRLMTVNIVTAVDTGQFHDPAWVTNLLHRFAAYYLDALDAYERHLAGTPAVWQVAFDGAGSANNHALQILLLGVNAHINYDLVLTLVDMLNPEWETLSTAQRTQRYEDHCHVNEVIGQTIDIVQDQVIEPVAPGMDLIDTMLGPLDEWLTSRLIAKWREEVWQNAVAWLKAADAAEREALRRQIESTTLKRADAILLNNGVLMLRSLF